MSSVALRRLLDEDVTFAHLYHVGLKELVLPGSRVTVAPTPTTLAPMETVFLWRGLVSTWCMYGFRFSSQCMSGSFRYM